METVKATILAVELKRVKDSRSGNDVPVANITVMTGAGRARGTLWFNAHDAEPQSRDEWRRTSSKDRSIKLLRELGWNGDSSFASLVDKPCLVSVEKEGKYTNVKGFYPMPQNVIDASILAEIMGMAVPNPDSENLPKKDDTDIPF